MKFFATETVIHAPAEKIWSLLTDADGWPSWSERTYPLTPQKTAAWRSPCAKSSPG